MNVDGWMKDAEDSKTNQVMQGLCEQQQQQFLVSSAQMSINNPKTCLFTLKTTLLRFHSVWNAILNFDFQLGLDSWIKPKFQNLVITFIKPILMRDDESSREDKDKVKRADFHALPTILMTAVDATAGHMFAIGELSISIQHDYLIFMQELMEITQRRHILKDRSLDEEKLRMITKLLFKYDARRVIIQSAKKLNPDAKIDKFKQRQDKQKWSMNKSMQDSQRRQRTVADILSDQNESLVKIEDKSKRYVLASQANKTKQKQTESNLQIRLVDELSKPTRVMKVVRSVDRKGETPKKKKRKGSQ